jgi:diguanylate cyclase (GGDEF)-like protein
MQKALRCLLALACLLAGAAGAAPGESLRPVTLQLKWKHQFQFAGYYAAIARGYYRDAGLEVKLAESAGEDTISTVLRGGADYGVANSEIALRRALGDPVVALATILQHSALALAVRGGANLTVHELAGRRIMVSPHDVELFAFLQREGLPPDRVRRVPQSFDIEDLVQGRVDGFSVYTTDQVYGLRKRGFVHTVLTPRSAGIDFYGDTLFTTEERARQDPKGVLAFRDASLRGWQYAMDHAEEIADLILERYGKRNSREQLLFEAGEMRRLMQPELIEIGHMNPGRWRHIVDVYAELGMVPRDSSIEGFLLESGPRADLARAYGWLAAAVAAALLIGTLALWQARRNRELRRAIRAREEAETQLRGTNEQMRVHLQEIRALQSALKEQAIRDPLTNLYNRRYLDETLERELRRAERQNHPVSVLVLDIDHFKKLNDAYGHPGGDVVLKALAGLLRGGVRGGDLACRWGGEEFVLLLHAADTAGAVERAEALREAFARLRVRYQDADLAATVSVGVATFPEHASSAEALMGAADAALYRAKNEGRNCVRAAPRMRAPAAT